MAWDVSKVTSYLANMGSNADPTLKQLSSYNLRHYVPKTSVFTLTARLKLLLNVTRRYHFHLTRNQNHPTRRSCFCYLIFLPRKYETMPSCLLQTILRGYKDAQNLISYIKPHRPVSPSTLARWIREFFA